MRRLFTNTVVTSIDYFILVVLNLLATPVLITHFGVAGYGAFVFLSIFSIYGALSFFDLGMEGSLMNFVARFDAAGDKRKLQDTLSISIVYYAVLGVILGALLYASAGFITTRLLDDSGALGRGTVMTALSYISINIVLQFLTIPFTAILQGLRRYVITKSINSILNVLRYGLVIAIALISHRIDLAFLVILGLTLLRLIILLAVFAFRLAYFRSMRIRLDVSLLRTLFSYSSILLVSRLIGLIWNQIDKILIWLYLAVASMTIYDVIARPAALLRLVMSILNSAVIPEVARLHENSDIAAIKNLYITLVRVAYLILLPILAVLYVYIGDLLHLWVGETFVPHAYLAAIFLSVYLVLPIASVASTVVIGMEKVKQTIWIAILATGINIVLSIVLLHFLGLAGLLVATLCSYLVSAPLYLWVMMKLLDFRIGDVMRPVLLIALPAAASCLLNLLLHYVLNGYYLLMGVVGIAILAVNYVFNFACLLTAREKDFLKERLTSMRTHLPSFF